MLRSCAALAFGAAVVNGVVGIALLVISYLVSAGAHGLVSIAGNVLVFSVIPLVALTGFFLDWAERPHDEGGGRFDEPEVKVRAHVVHLRDWRPIAILAFIVCVAGATPARAHQTIFNVASTDALDRGKVYYGELDVTWKPVEPRLSSFVPRVVVGTGGKVEIGLNVAGNVQPGTDATALSPTPGMAFKPHSKVTGYIGYSIGNTGVREGNHFFYTAVGFNFN